MLSISSLNCPDALGSNDLSTNSLHEVIQSVGSISRAGKARKSKLGKTAENDEESALEKAAELTCRGGEGPAVSRGGGLRSVTSVTD